MVKPKARKLKVFQAQFGFYDTVVAAASQAAALRAWGTRQNLFASGEAKITTDEAAVAAATAHPDTPLRRAIGSTEAFALESTSLPQIPEGPKKAATKCDPSPKSKAPAAPPADRSKLDAAEKALGWVDERRKHEEADFRREEQELKTRQTVAQSAYVEARKVAKAKVLSARNAYREAGGID